MTVDAVRLSGIHKAFGSNAVLRGIDLEFPHGRITALMGANGAGKSTLVKILSGVHRADAGTVAIAGKPTLPESPRAALQAGIVTVHQHVDDGVVPDLDVACNLMLDRLAAGDDGPRYRRRFMHRQAQAIAARLGLDLPMSRPVRELGLAERQLVAIARAMAHEPRLLILDEPTSSLSGTEAERLFVLLDRLRSQGVAVVYISHRLSDIRRLADRVVCLRDGVVSGTFDEQPLDLSAAAQAMLGRSLDDETLGSPNAGDPILDASGLTLRNTSAAFDLSLRANEIVAVIGLVGAGKSELARVLFGLARPAAGDCRLDGVGYRPRSVREAIDRGVFLCPKDRAAQALVPGLDLAANISLPFTAQVSSAAILRPARERSVARRTIDTLGIVCRGAGDRLSRLSGGNQQKAMIGRWLWQDARLLVLDEPFQGVDIGARRDITRHLRATASRRATLVLVSELDEALEVADRILVMVDGAVIADHRRDGIDQEQLLRQMTTTATPSHALAS